MRAWTAAEVKSLERMVNAGESWAAISTTLNRTPGSCQWKASAAFVISDAAKKKRWEDSRKRQGEAQRGRVNRLKEKMTSIGNTRAASENPNFRTRPCSRCRKVFTTPHKCRFLCDGCNSYASSMGWF